MGSEQLLSDTSNHAQDWLAVLDHDTARPGRGPRPNSGEPLTSRSPCTRKAWWSTQACLVFPSNVAKLRHNPTLAPGAMLVGAEEKAMNRTELIDHLGSRFPALTPKDVELAVKTIQSAMIAQLQAGEHIEIRGFGSFALSYRPPRTARNPKTGASVAVKGRYVPHFKAGKNLRERVNRPEPVPQRKAA